MLATEAATPNEGCGFRIPGEGSHPGAGDRGAHKFPLAVVGILRTTANQCRDTTAARRAPLLIRIEAFGHVLQIETGKLEPAPPEVSDMPQPMVVPAEVGFTIHPEADE